jgi:hypothetical protein
MGWITGREISGGAVRERREEVGVDMGRKLDVGIIRIGKR